MNEMVAGPGALLDASVSKKDDEREPTRMGECTHDGVLYANVHALSSLALLALAVSGCGDATHGPDSRPTMGGAAGVAMAGSGGDAGTTSALAGASGNAGASSGSGGVSAGAGGTSDGGANAGSSGSAGAGGGAPQTLCEAGNCSAFTDNFDGFLFEYPCAAGDGCSGQMCVMNALTISHAFKLGGDASKVYRVDFHVRGVTESKNYEGGARRSTLPIDPGAAGGDLWYEGGTAPVSTYSSYELHVTPPVAGAPNDYYLNARDGTGEHDGTTWALNYAASVKVNGGGTITFKTFDSNCSAITNCGPKGGSGCMPRTFDLSDAVPAPNATQPILNANMKSVQWLHIDVTSVEAL